MPCLLSGSLKILQHMWETLTQSSFFWFQLFLLCMFLYSFVLCLQLVILRDQRITKPPILFQIASPFCCSCCSVSQSCTTICDTKDYSTQGFPVLHYLLEFVQTYVHWVCDASNHLVLCRPLLLLPSIFLSIRVFSISRLFASGGQSSGASVSASVFPMNIQGWFPLGSTGLTSLLSKGISRVFFSNTVWKHWFFGTQPSLWSNSHIHTWLLEKP